MVIYPIVLLRGQMTRQEAIQIFSIPNLYRKLGQLIRRTRQKTLTSHAMHIAKFSFMLALELLAFHHRDWIVDDSVTNSIS